ncbi:MAG: ubiquinone/menaquinone biosynthesis methyltransferase [Calditrichaeota bacterium]|nr:ubiquinone/menaquinone biosynthesis methyltransferase [Calditrichota bacterium]
MKELTPLYERFKNSEEKEKYVIDLFSKIDKNYDQMNRYMSFGMDMSWRKRAIKLGNFPKNSFLLDVAAGTGDFTLSALKQLPEARIIGIDFCMSLLKIAKQKFASQNGKYQVDWVYGNGLRLPFPDNSFDGVITGFSLRNVTAVRGFFQEFYRVTKPGGKVVSVEMMRPTKPFQKRIFAIHHKKIVPALGKLLASFPDAYTYLPLSIENFYSSDELVDEITSVGWKNVRYKSMMFGFIAAHLGEK